MQNVKKYLTRKHNNKWGVFQYTTFVYGMSIFKLNFFITLFLAAIIFVHNFLQGNLLRWCSGSELGLSDTTLSTFIDISILMLEFEFIAVQGRSTCNLISEIV